MFQELLAHLVTNASIVVAAAVLYDLIGLPRVGRRGLGWRLVLGAALGLLVVTLMLDSFELMPGVVFDTRSVLLAISGLFFGALPTGVAAAVAIVLRLGLGGPGTAMGVAVILLSAGLGLAYRYRLGRRLDGLSPSALYVFGLVVHLGMLACTVLLPAGIRLSVLSRIALPVLVVYPLFTAAAGWAFFHYFTREAERRMEQQLGQTLELQARVVEAVPVAVVTLDLEGRVTSWNPAAERIFGWEREEVLGRPNPIVPEEASGEFEAFQREVLEGVALKGALRLRRRKDGRPVWVRLTAGALRDPAGEPAGLIAVFEEVTAEVLEGHVRGLMIALARALPGAGSEEELLQAVCGAAVAEGGYRLAWAGRALPGPGKPVVPVASAGFEDGYLESLALTWEDEPRGRGPGGGAIRERRMVVCHDIVDDPAFEPWRADALARGYRSAAAVPIEAGGRVWGVLNLYAPEPAAFPTSVQIRLGELAAALGLGVEAMEARRRVEEAAERNRRLVRRLELLRELDRAILAARGTEELIRAVLDHMGSLVPADRVSVALLEEEGDTVRVFARGLKERDLGEGTVIPFVLSFLDPEGLRRGEPTVVEDVEALEEPLPPTVEALREAGIRSFASVPGRVGERLVLVLNLGFTGPEGPDAEVMEAAGDVADVLAIGVEQERTRAELAELNRELEEKVRRRTAQLEAANRELEAFAHSVSHDLRAPLRAMDGFSRILEEDFGPTLPAEAREHLGRIREGARRMGRMIEALLGLSRIGRRELTRRRVDLSAMAREVLEELVAAEPGRRFDLRVQPGLEAEADPDLVRILLQNLLGNAVKFTAGREPAVIEVGAERTPEGTVFFVRDNGAGFDPAHAAMLFGPFQRLHPRSEFPGLGIGLATAERIVARHGGRIWGEGRPGQGAVFRFILEIGEGES